MQGWVLFGVLLAHFRDFIYPPRLSKEAEKTLREIKRSRQSGVKYKEFLKYYNEKVTERKDQ
jgi:hypothetical protein